MAYTRFESEDIILGNVVNGVTSTLFSENASSLTAFHTSSTQTASVSGPYQFEIYNSNPQSDTNAQVQFSIAYGHFKGSGSVRQTGATAGNSPTKAVFSQFRNLLLDDPTDTTAFVDADGSGHGAAFFVTMNRARFKQGVNPGNWELHLSASAGHYTKSVVKVIDDSTVSDGSTVNGHLVYNIVSGSETDGVYSDGSSNTHYWGKFYPELGILQFSANKFREGNTLGPQSSPGLGMTIANSANTNDDMNGKFYDMINRGKFFAIRSQEDVASTHYFIRVKNSQYNYSTNHTYQRTGSTGNINGQLLHNSFIQNPQTFITTVGLYNDFNELLAVAKLSKPLLKNFERETTIRIKLDH
tara:strand:- start:502 stop:1569 length:1068 start_codon:yes stop_codon:yes gene_type:complete